MLSGLIGKSVQFLITWHSYHHPLEVFFSKVAGQGNHWLTRLNKQNMDEIEKANLDEFMQLNTELEDSTM